MHVPRGSAAAAAAVMAMSLIAQCAGQGGQALTKGKYTDPDTGVTMVTWTEEPDDVGNGAYTFGMALPEDAATKNVTEYIGMLRCQKTSESSTGWCGIAHGGMMLRNLLLMAWPYEDTVQTSFRWAEAYFPPDVYLGNSTLQQISSWVNETAYEVIFRCTDCLWWTLADGTVEGAATAGPGGGESSEDGSPLAPGQLTFGHAQSHDSPSNGGCPDDMSMMFHDNGFGEYTADVLEGASESYAEWAALATQTVKNWCAAETSS